MIEISRLELNSVIWRVVERNNYNSRIRIIRTDSDGTVWHRYTLPKYQYSVETLKLVGRVIMVVQGNITDPDDYVNQYQFEKINGDLTALIDERDNAYTDHCYTTLEEATLAATAATAATDQNNDE